MTDPTATPRTPEQQAITLYHAFVGRGFDNGSQIRKGMADAIRAARAEGEAAARRQIEALTGALAEALESGIGFAVAFRQDHGNRALGFPEVGRLFARMTSIRDAALASTPAPSSGEVTLPVEALIERGVGFATCKVCDGILLVPPIANLRVTGHDDCWLPFSVQARVSEAAREVPK